MYSNPGTADGFIDPLLLNKQESSGPRLQHTTIDSDCRTARSFANESIPGQVLGNLAAWPAPHHRNPNTLTELTAGNARALDSVLDGGPGTQKAEPIRAAVGLEPVGGKPFHSRSSKHSKETAAQSTSSSLGVGLKTAESHAAVRKMTVKKRGRPRKTSTNDASNRGKSAIAADVRAQRIRDKNRAAADKCRLRRRLEEDGLRAKQECIQELHRNLTTSLSDLSEEVHVLRNMLLAHGTCDCSLIQDYLKRTASKWVQLKRSTALGVAA